MAYRCPFSAQCPFLGPHLPCPGASFSMFRFNVQQSPLLPPVCLCRAPGPRERMGHSLAQEAEQTQTTVIVEGVHLACGLDS